MSIVIPEGFSNATFIWTCAGSIRQKTTSLGIGSADSGANSPDTIAIDLYGFITDTDAPCDAAAMLPDYTFIGVSVTKTESGLPVIGQKLDPFVGVNSGGAPPSNGAVVIKKLTSAGGRRNRGRMFCPPIRPSDANIDASGFMTPTLQGLIQDQWDAFFATAFGELYPFCLFHSDGGTPTPITSFSVESQLGTQRRRMR